MEQRNVLLAIVFSVAILISWQILVDGPRMEKQRAAQEAAKAAQGTTQQTKPGAPGQAAPPSPGATGVLQVPGVPRAPIAGQPAVSSPAARAKLISGVDRIELKSKALRGSISLKGARIDDLTLTQYRETIDKKSPNITFLSPQQATNAYYAQFGWVAYDESVKVPGTDAVWKADRRTLTPSSPVTLVWDNGEGLEFVKVISLDQNYMFKVTQRVVNRGAKSVKLAPYGLISRTGTPETLGFYILHEGLLGVFDETLTEIDYDDLQDDGSVKAKSKGGWIGITDKYWLAALIPSQTDQVNYDFIHTQVNKQDKYQVNFLGTAATIAPATSSESSNHLFAGAKVVRLLDKYEETLGIPKFDKAVDFGLFYYLTKPIFYAMEYFNRLLGNFGLAILLLTVCIKILFFPLANKSYKSMSRLKVLQPKMMEIRDRFKDDRVRQNQAMMELYKKEKANPMSGCLPILIQIPVFFALYKVLYVTIEMRHSPFYGWIHDLSAPDPLGLLTAFGLIDWNVPEILAVANIGIWPIIMGLTMFLQQKLNPQPADPMQAKIFMFLPLIFTFLLGSFPAGLVIYWAWNNLLSITQQWIIMRRMGVSASGQAVAPALGGGGGNTQSGGTSAQRAAAGNGTGNPKTAKSAAKAKSTDGNRAANANGSKKSNQPRKKRKKKPRNPENRPGAR